MTSIDDAFAAVPELVYTHHERLGETLHRSHVATIRREVTSLDVHAGHQILEVGTGSGFSGAILQQLAGPKGRVTSVDVNPAMVARATAIHRERGVDGVDCLLADGLAGYPPAAPFDRIAGWCALPRLPSAWIDQLVDGGRIVTCLPLVALPYITTIATITASGGVPHVAAVTSGGYVQSREQAYDDVHVPHRWVDWTEPDEQPYWIAVGWRDHDPDSAGARTALHQLAHPGYTETYAGAPVDWNSWTAFTATLGDPALSNAHLPGRGHAIGHTARRSAAMLHIDGTVIADARDSPSLTVLHAWLERWEHAGRPVASTLTATLVRNKDGACPGWDLRVHR